MRWKLPRSQWQWAQRYNGRQDQHICPLRVAANSAAEPAWWDALSTYESANGQVTVASQHNDLPLCQGTKETPSRRFPFDRNNPAGSLYFCTTNIWWIKVVWKNRSVLHIRVLIWRAAIFFWYVLVTYYTPSVISNDALIPIWWS